MEFDDYHQRNGAEAAQLNQHSVSVCGSGAVGSQVALMLAKDGMNLDLVDRDVLSLANLHRCAADAQYVGEPKSWAVARSLRRQIPEAQQISAVQADLALRDPSGLADLILRRGRPSVLVATTGSDTVDAALDRFCNVRDIPLVAAGLYRNDHPLLGEIQVAGGRWLRGRACFE